MSRTEPTVSEDEAADLIALILAGAAIPEGMTVGEGVAGILTLAGFATIVASTVGGFVSRLSDVEGIPSGGQSQGQGVALRRAQEDALSYAALYLVSAAKRIGASVAAEEGIGEAINSELPNLSKHLDAQGTRLRGAALNDSAADRWGPILNWNHTGTSLTHRPTHVAADGANYDIRRRPLSTNGALPAQEEHCDCVPAAPVAGARMLA